jgi:hypothetical protein
LSTDASFAPIPYHIDDAAAGTLLVHVGKHGAGGEERAVEMDRQELLPVGAREGVEDNADAA